MTSLPEQMQAAAAAQVEVGRLLDLYARGSRPMPIPWPRCYPSSRVGPPTYLEPPMHQCRTHTTCLSLAPLPLHKDALMDALLRLGHHDAFHNKLESFRQDAVQYVSRNHRSPALPSELRVETSAPLAHWDAREWLFARNMHLQGILIWFPEFLVPAPTSSTQWTPTGGQFGRTVSHV